MKCLYIITNGDLGGAQVHLLDLISNLPQTYQVEVIVGDKGWLWNALRDVQVKKHCVETLAREINPIRDVKTIFRIKEIIKKMQPDIIHCHSSKAGFLGRIAGVLCAVPVIFTAHGWAFTEGVSPKKRMFYLLLERLAAKWAQKIICVSEYDRQLALNMMPKNGDKLVTIHNGITDMKEVTKSDIHSAEMTLKIAMVARFSQPKDHKILLNALAELKKEKFRFKASFVGDGPLLKEIEFLAKSMDLSEDINFLGAKSNVDEILKKQDVFVLMSKWEGLPISILEAMREGLPVIASNVGGVGEAVIDGKTGFLIPRDDVSCLAKRLKEVQDNLELRIAMGIHGRNRFEEYFTIDKMMEETLKTYNQVAQNS
jgi:glycosyltransferase involved in cell wall biosynthesis